MDSFLHRGIRLEYEVNGNGIPFVFLHGMGGSVEQIHKTYEPLPGVQLITLNQQGHGNTEADWNDYNFNRLGDDVIALLDYLHIPSAVVAGISMGAAVSLNITVRYPKRVDKLLLIRNAWTDQPMLENVQMAYEVMGKCLNIGEINCFLKTKEWKKIIERENSYTRKAFTCTFEDESCLKFWKKYLLLPKQAPIPSTDCLKMIDMPVVILANHNDLCHPFFYGEYLQQYIPRCELIEIPSKDEDEESHKKAINTVIQQMLYTSSNICSTSSLIG